MMIKKSTLCTTESFMGQSIEEKVRKTLDSGAPIEAISPMIYTERKDGCRPETNIRTDRFEIAMKAMTTIADGRRQKRAERIAEKDAKRMETPSSPNQAEA